jgi:hypothetical protein
MPFIFLCTSQWGVGISGVQAMKGGSSQIIKAEQEGKRKPARKWAGFRESIRIDLPGQAVVPLKRIPDKHQHMTGHDKPNRMHHT